MGVGDKPCGMRLGFIHVSGVTTWLLPVSNSSWDQNIPCSTNTAVNVCPLLKGTSPSPNGLGYARIPGVFSPEQTESWKVVTDAVHSEGGRIFLQLMHAGRCGVAGAVDGGHERHGLDRQPGGAALWLVSDIFAFTLALFMIFWCAAAVSG